MEANRQSAGSSLDSSIDSSSSAGSTPRANSPPYADIENGSRFELISYKNYSSSSMSTATGRSSKAVKILSLVSLFVSITCLLCIGAFCCWVFVFNDTLPFPQSSKLVGGRETEVCVPCLQVSPDPLDSNSGLSDLWRQLDVRSDPENDTKICCAVDASQYAVLLKLILQRQQEVQRLAAYLESTNDTDEASENEVTGRELPRPQQITNSLSAVSAHLVFKPPSQRTTEGEDPTVQQWKSPAESPTSHLQKGLKFYNHDRVLVQTPGLYYVYCQILYTPSYTNTPNTDMDLASAYVRRYSILHPASPSFLLKSRHTRADSQDRHSSYAGGVFRLHKGDSLYVQVSRPDLISHDDVASFFGLFKVGP